MHDQTPQNDGGVLQRAHLALKITFVHSGRELAAVLIEKAADLKSQVDETMPSDPSPLAPDVEPADQSART